ncbi:hypothetical protein O181_002205 [Austropuccinia psidii MF-1]|uniref:Uncharacterized protein n=1 Tax=Austropuccinia psidii MF-1 TaxID=1389203 RepID=A0A9Q3GCL4_9BASI|nr:hypothetical protein [Austropuccinia psidii MF-1]
MRKRLGKHFLMASGDFQRPFLDSVQSKAILGPSYLMAKMWLWTHLEFGANEVPLGPIGFRPKGAYRPRAVEALGGLNGPKPPNERGCARGPGAGLRGQIPLEGKETPQAQNWLHWPGVQQGVELAKQANGQEKMGVTKGLLKPSEANWPYIG